MQKRTYLAVIAAAAVLLSTGSVLSVRAPTAPGLAPHAIVPVAASGTPGRIARFTSATDLGNSVLHQDGADIGLGTTSPLAKLDIRDRNALNIMAVQPFVTFRDTKAGNARHRIQSVNGGLSLVGENALNGSDRFAFVHIDRRGRVGLGTANPQRALQIGPGFDPMFTIEPSDGSPRAGFIRFGDKTGWQLRIGRSREFSGGPLNTGLTGALFTFRDDGAFGPTGYPLLATGVEPLCRTLANFITRCEASSLRYKTNVEPYRGGLDVINRLRPIAFTRKHNGAADIGLAAEDVEKVEPRLTYRNENDEVEGVKYDLLTAVLVNAIKEQEERLQRQQEEIEQLQSALARLEKMN